LEKSYLVKHKRKHDMENDALETELSDATMVTIDECPNYVIL
jgi:hypothetical protein